MRTLSNTTTDRPIPVTQAALSVDEFCAAHCISRALFYLLQRDGAGPRLMRVRGAHTNHDRSRSGLAESDGSRIAIAGRVMGAK
jgi:hypothetical protein